MDELKNNTAFITGAAGGIGLGMARTFAKAGMNVVISDIQREQLAVAEAELNAITDNVLALVVDSTSPDSLKQAAARIEQSFGALHVLCNNAGIGGGAKILDTEDEKWRNVMDVNFSGPLNGINQFLHFLHIQFRICHIIIPVSFNKIEFLIHIPSH